MPCFAFISLIAHATNSFTSSKLVLAIFAYTAVFASAHDEPFGYKTQAFPALSPTRCPRPTLREHVCQRQPSGRKRLRQDRSRARACANRAWQARDTRRCTFLFSCQQLTTAPRPFLVYLFPVNPAIL